MKSSTMKFIFILMIINIFYSIGFLAVTNEMYYSDGNMNTALAQISAVSGDTNNTSLYAQYSDKQVSDMTNNGLLNPVADGQSNTLLEKMVKLPKMMGQVVNLMFMSIFHHNVQLYGTEEWELILIGIITTVLGLLNLLMIIAFFREVILKIPV